jgi:hypothetical protein
MLCAADHNLGRPHVGLWSSCRKMALPFSTCKPCTVLRMLASSSQVVNSTHQRWTGWQSAHVNQHQGAYHLSCMACANTVRRPLVQQFQKFHNNLAHHSISACSAAQLRPANHGSYPARSTVHCRSCQQIPRCRHAALSCHLQLCAVAVIRHLLLLTLL